MVASTVAVISAASQEVTLEGIKFNIPDGYNAVEQDSDVKEVGDSEDIDGTAVDTEVTNDYITSAGDELEIKVGARENQKIDSINPVGAEAKKIAGKEGFLFKEMDDGKEQYKFEYLQDGKIVKITAVSEDVISQVIG